jgi:MFS transporter, AAHS family, 4-hydroxybenzoate transporter
MAAATATLNLSRFINERRMGSFQYLVIVLCALTVFLDGFDTQSVAFVGPALAAEWHVSARQLGPIFVASLVGLFIGALAFGVIADKFGRRRVLMASTAIFAIFTLATASSVNVTELLIFRFIAGLGLGGGMPNSIALTAEYCPRRRRGACVMIMFAGFSLGAAAAGGISAAIIPAFGWRAVWWVGGVLPLALLAIQYVYLPESIRHLALTAAAPERIASILRKIDPTAHIGDGLRYELGEERAPGAPVSHLFRGGRAFGTLMLWFMFFANLLDLFFLQNWIPIIAHTAGASVRTAVTIGAMFQAGGFLASFLLGIAVDSFGGYVVLAVMYFCAGLIVIAIGRTAGAEALGALTFLAGFCVVGAQNSANAAAALFYPTAVRSTGVGWSLGVGRLGAIAGPLVGASLVSLNWPTRSMFLLGSVPLFCAMAAAIAIAVAYRGGRSVAYEDMAEALAEETESGAAVGL